MIEHKTNYIVPPKQKKFPKLELANRRNFPSTAAAESRPHRNQSLRHGALTRLIDRCVASAILRGFRTNTQVNRPSHGSTASSRLALRITSPSQDPPLGCLPDARDALLGLSWLSRTMARFLTALPPLRRALTRDTSKGSKPSWSSTPEWTGQGHHPALQPT